MRQRDNPPSFGGFEGSQGVARVGGSIWVSPTFCGGGLPAREVDLPRLATGPCPTVTRILIFRKENRVQIRAGVSDDQDPPRRTRRRLGDRVPPVEGRSPRLGL